MYCKNWKIKFKILIQYAVNIQRNFDCFSLCHLLNMNIKFIHITLEFILTNKYDPKIPEIKSTSGNNLNVKKQCCIPQIKVSSIFSLDNIPLKKMPYFYTSTFATLFSIF